MREVIRTNCMHCDCPVAKADSKSWRWAGWVVYGPAPSAPSRASGIKTDEWDFLFHKQCFPEWLENRNGFLQDLDQPVNASIHFHRTGSSIHGYYVRDDKKHPCLASWKNSDILGTSLFPTSVGTFPMDFLFVTVTVSDGKAFLSAFQNFLEKNGWLNDGWYEPRKPFIVKSEVADRMKAKHAQER